MSAATSSKATDVLVVLAQGQDAAARRLAAGWPGAAGVLTCRDLSRRGWRYAPGGAPGTAVIDGRLVPTRSIDGVLVRLPYAHEAELGAIAPEDRSYVASEMTACLSAWLSELACPVLNRPGPVHLMGPDWAHERWLCAAARLGIRTLASRRSVPVGAPDPVGDGALTMTVIGGRALGDGHGDGDGEAVRSAARAAARAAVALARAAGVVVLRAHFAAGPDGPAFAGADYWVDVDDPAVASALVACVTSGPA
jgi:hypothetical protein